MYPLEYRPKEQPGNHSRGYRWELFKNYLIAKEKFKPDFVLYENNKSAAQPIKDQIAKELGVGVDPLTRFTYINSALVSAQNRQRFYVTNFGDIEQPDDRGILLRDILETGSEAFHDKSYALTTRCQGAIPSDTFKKHRHTMVAEPVYVGEIPGHNGKYRNGKQASQQYRVFSIEGESVCCDTDSRKYIAVPVTFDGDVPLTAISCADDKTYQVYEVRDGMIAIKDVEYPIKLPDGYYIIRKLTVTECCRLRTMPDDYCKAVSATQGYKGLGNGWTAEVVIHLLNHVLKDVPRNEEIVVLSMYDGIGTGRYCLDKMGFTNVKYHAYEIDKYAMAVANDNYPDIIQHGDAFAVREDDWSIL